MRSERIKLTGELVIFQVSFHPLSGRCDRKGSTLAAVERSTNIVSIPFRGDVIGKPGDLIKIKWEGKGFHPLSGRCDRKVNGSISY